MNLPFQVLPVDFFNESPLRVARLLLGCTIVRVLAGERLSGRIVETEAYGGLRDPACHVVARDKRIWELLSGPPGFIYLHRSYKHTLLNIVSDTVGNPGCILVRALEPLSGQTAMRTLRHGSADLTNGPARLCEALAIEREWECTQLPRPDFWFESGPPVADDNVLNTGRIGLKYGRDLLWRFALAGNSWVSRPLKPAP